jgi:hypothetical protein
MYKLRGMQTCWLKLWPFSANQSGKSAQHKSCVQPHYSVMPKTTWPSYFKRPASLGSAIVICLFFSQRLILCKQVNVLIMLIDTFEEIIDVN